MDREDTPPPWFPQGEREVIHNGLLAMAAAVVVYLCAAILLLPRAFH